MYTVFDIETASNKSANEYHILQSSKISTEDQKPPASITSLKTDALREERIKQWHIDQETKRQESLAKAIEKSALFWWTGQVICISTHDLRTGDDRSFFGNNETQILTDFRNFLNQDPNNLIGKNAIDFDIPFLIGRYIANNMALPHKLRLCNYDELRDINRIFSYSNSCSQITSLDNYAWGMQIDGKTSDGSKVPALYDQANSTNDPHQQSSIWQGIVTYCGRDVFITTEILRRWLRRET